MKLLTALAIAALLYWQKPPVYYFPETHTVYKPEPPHTVPWRDSDGAWRPAGVR